MQDISRPYVDFLILADHAEAINGRLYMMGGGFDVLMSPNFSAPVQFSIALGVIVPWNAANEAHALRVVLEHEDGRQAAEPMEMGLNVGRPSTAIPGQEFRAIIAINAVFKLGGPGTYRVAAKIGDEEARKAVFHARLVDGTRVQRGTQPL